MATTSRALDRFPRDLAVDGVDLGGDVDVDHGSVSLLSGVGSASGSAPWRGDVHAARGRVRWPARRGAGSRTGGSAPATGRPPAGRGVHGVQPPGAFGTDRREPAVPEHAQVLRHGRLGDLELLLDDRGDRSGGLLLVREQLQDPAPNRITQNVEGVHAPTIPAVAYISQACYLPVESRWSTPSSMAAR